MKFNYRPEIDGLRAIAVISVIIYHAQITILDTQLFSGGFIGVDIFFVISGYLITSIILNELIKTEFFSFKNFYIRRSKRILPALLFVILVSIPFSWIYLYPIDLVNFSKSILYSLGFGSNFYFHYSGLEYGSPEALLKPFLHTWSLSVEEQYYLLFPIVLVSIFKFYKKYFFYFLLFSLIVSLMLADWGSKNYPSSTFYFLHTRMWELICGSIIAYFEIKQGHRSQNKFLSQLLPIVGLSFIIYSVLFFDKKIPHPSLYTLVPVFGVSLILWFTNKFDIISKILSHKLFVGVGLISYSLYLWHYPIFSFAKNLALFFDDYYGKFILIFISIILSIFTYYFIEQPARKTYSTKKFFFTMFFTASIIFIYAFMTIINDGFLNRVKVNNYQKKHTYNYLSQDGQPCFGRTKDFCKFGNYEKKIILLGDSHLGSLSYDLHNRTKFKYSFLPITLGGYFHLREIKQTNKHSQKINIEYEILRNNIDNILKTSKNNIIIIGGVTSLYFHNKRIEGRANHWDYMFVNKDSLKYDLATIENSFINLIKKLSVDNDVILLYPIPEIGVNLQKKKFENMVRVFNYKYSDFLKQNNEVMDFFNTIDQPGVHKVYSYRVFCNEETNLCSTHSKDNFFFFDGYHPSIEGSKMINDLIIKKIKSLEVNNER